MNETRSTVWTRLTKSLFGRMACGGILLWLSMPPVHWSWLAWVALVPWVSVVVQPTLAGRRPYLQIGMACLMYWLCTLYFIPIPHPLLWFGWVAMSAYLTLYPMLFIALARWMVWSWRTPAITAVPFAFTLVEWLRTQGPMGFGMIHLSHSQFRNPWLIQILDLLGGFGLTYFMVLFATGLVVFWQSRLISSGDAMKPRSSPSWFGLGMSAMSLGIVMGYGAIRFSQIQTTLNELDTSTSPVALVIQGSIDTTFPSPQEWENVSRRHTEDYRRLTLQARQDHPSASLVIWPESIFQASPQFETKLDSRAGDLPVNFLQIHDYWVYCTCPLDPNTGIPSGRPVELITGTLVYLQETEECYNSAVAMPSMNRYDKEFRVLFGEYLPMSEQFPALAAMTPIGKGLLRGDRLPLLVAQNGAAFCPSVCFESTVPHLIRRNLHRASQDTQATQFPWLLNLTNDGWFFGTSCLDFHLACNVFRSTELRTPGIVAANTGISAEVSPAGEIKQLGPRRREGTMGIELYPPPAIESYYRRWGDWTWFGLFGGLWLVSILFRRQTSL